MQNIYILEKKNERYTDPNLIELVTNLASRQYKNKNEYTKYYKKLIKASDIDYNPRGGPRSLVTGRSLDNTQQNKTKQVVGIPVQWEPHR